MRETAARPPAEKPGMTKTGVPAEKPRVTAPA
jgi:hypothetical protein